MYAEKGGNWQGPPVAAFYMTGFTHTKAPQDSAPASGLRTNDNLASQQVSGFIAGRLYDNLGSFIQVTGDPTFGGVSLDASDLRYADEFKLFGKDAIWGLDANNSPTVEDPWNTTPSWGWPQISSTIAPAFAPPLTHIEGSYTSNVGGAGAYMFWDDMLYTSLIAYKGLPVPVLQALGASNSTTDALTNVAPYWRVAFEPHWGSHYLMVGTFGMYGQVVPGREYGFGTDNFLDVGVDSQYQYDGDQYSLTVKLTDIMEWQKLNATYALAGASNINNTLNSFKANASFVWDHTYSLGFGYFNVNGSHDCNMYGSPAAPCMPSGPGPSPTASWQAQTATASSSTSPTALSCTGRRDRTTTRPGTSASAFSSPGTSTSMAGRTISTAPFWAARITRPATTRSSPMRGWRSKDAAHGDGRKTRMAARDPSNPARAATYNRSSCGAKIAVRAPLDVVIRATRSRRPLASLRISIAPSPQLT